MKTVFEYSHLGGAEILRSRYPGIDAAIDEAIRAVGNDFRTKLSREKGRRFGTMLYDPKSMNRAFEREFTARGFSEIKRSFDVDVPGWKQPRARLETDRLLP